jgi:hypothetical protein
MAKDRKIVSMQLVAPNIRTVVLQVWMDDENFDKAGTHIYHIIAIRDILYDDGEYFSRFLLADTDCSDDDMPDIRYIEGTNCLQRTIACPWPFEQDEERFKHHFDVMMHLLKEKIVEQQSSKKSRQSKASN